MKARFLRRLNRFVVECAQGKRVVRAYLPNPGRLWEILLPGRLLYLKERGKGALPLVFAGEREGAILCLDTRYANRLAETWIQEGRIPGLAQYRVVAREVPVGRHRIDFLLAKGSRSFPLEVKSCTLYAHGIAMFPDAVTERGRKHLELLASRGGALLFLVYHPSARFFLPDFHTDPAFSRTLYRLRHTLSLHAIAVHGNEAGEFRYAGELTIPWELYEREAEGLGGMIIVGQAKAPFTLPGNARRKPKLKEGYLVAVISREETLSLPYSLKKDKEDEGVRALLPYLDNLRRIPIRSRDPLQCQISQGLSQIFSEAGEGFGNGRCSCRTHLYWSRTDPLMRPEFVELLLWFRIGRLKEMLIQQGGSNPQREDGKEARAQA